MRERTLVHLSRLHVMLQGGEPVGAQPFYPGDTDVGLLSRYPILSQQLIAPADMRSAFIRVQVNVQGTPVAVYVVHLASPHIALPLTYDDSARDREVAYVLERLREETGPVLLLGDFNLSDQSDAYRSFDRLLADAFRERGASASPSRASAGSSRP